MFFVPCENNPSSLINVPKCVKQIINAEHVYINDSSMERYIEILSEYNTLKTITICFGLYTYFALT